MRPFLLAILLSSPVAAAERWNVLLITADDLNGDSMGWMGHPAKLTPNLDAFAATAHQFVNHHVTVPICQPSRSAFMTGRVPHRNGALGFHPIRTDVPTLVETLNAAGYFSCAINKTAHMKPDAKFPWATTREGSGKEPATFGTHVRECLQAAAAAKKPFFLNANITDPHRPFAGAPPNKKGKGEGSAIKAMKVGIAPVPGFLADLPDVRKEYAQYLTSVARLDQSFGELMKELKASGRENDTLIVFLSDHGMSMPFSKATVFRNGTWVPLLVRIPGEKPQKRDEFVSSVDLMPSLLELLKVNAPDAMDGRSWVPLLKGQSQPDRDFVVTHVNTVSSGKSFPQRCIRTKDRSLIWHGWANGKTPLVVEAHHGLTYNAMTASSDPAVKARIAQIVTGTPLAFYDLTKDPDERVNVIGKSEYQSDLARLSKLLRDHMERTGDPQLAHFDAAWKKNQKN